MITDLLARGIGHRGIGGHGRVHVHLTPGEVNALWHLTQWLGHAVWHLDWWVQVLLVLVPAAWGFRWLSRWDPLHEG